MLTQIRKHASRKSERRTPSAHVREARDASRHRHERARRSVAVVQFEPFARARAARQFEAHVAEPQRSKQIEH